MKAVMLSKEKASHLFDHVIDGFEKSYQGIENARQLELFNQEEELELLRKNSERLIERIKEWKMLNKLVSIFFAFVFSLMQIAGADLYMRRSTRVRTGRRNETTHYARQLFKIIITDFYKAACAKTKGGESG